MSIDSLPSLGNGGFPSRVSRSAFPLLGRERQLDVSSYRFVPMRSSLHSALTWSEEIPQNQTQQRQEHHY